MDSSEVDNKVFEKKVAPQKFHPILLIGLLLLVIATVITGVYLNVRTNYPTFNANASVISPSLVEDISPGPTEYMPPKESSLSPLDQWKVRCLKTNVDSNTKFKECEIHGISTSAENYKKACSEIGGTFNACASACRHQPPGTPCTMMCVQVCEFK